MTNTEWILIAVLVAAAIGLGAFFYREIGVLKKHNQALMTDVKGHVTTTASALNAAIKAATAPPAKAAAKASASVSIDAAHPTTVTVDNSDPANPSVSVVSQPPAQVIAAPAAVPAPAPAPEAPKTA